MSVSVSVLNAHTPRPTRMTRRNRMTMTMTMTSKAAAAFCVILTFMMMITSTQCITQSQSQSQDKDAGSSVFLQLPYSNPPTVKSPPYYESNDKCPAINLRENWIDTLCGDLNTGHIPINPMGYAFPDGSSYPFEIIKNKTLDFFRRALPILKSDKSLPKVAKFNPYEVTGLVQAPESYHFRMRRDTLSKSSSRSGSMERLTWLLPPKNTTSAVPEVEVEARSGQFGGFASKPRPAQFSRFCDKANPMTTPGALTYFHRFCNLYNTMWGKTPYQSHYSGPPPLHHPDIQRYDKEPNYQHRITHHLPIPSPSYKRPPLAPAPAPFPSRHHKRYEALYSSDSAKIEAPPIPTAPTSSSSSSSSSSPSLPPTPCPSQVEYLTPVFARNHEGSWRYIVQIPREGYFTQTVEVTKCSESACFYMDGDCKSSPRWQSLLVAEMYYPDTSFPTTTSAPSGAVTPNYENSNENSEYHKYQQYLKKKRGVVLEHGGAAGDHGERMQAGSTSSGGNSDDLEIPPECDGIDHIGCFQVRLFYDWFLIPGSCKCWRRTFDFTRVHNNRLV